MYSGHGTRSPITHQLTVVVAAEDYNEYSAPATYSHQTDFSQPAPGYPAGASQDFSQPGGFPVAGGAYGGWDGESEHSNAPTINSNSSHAHHEQSACSSDHSADVDSMS